MQYLARGPDSQRVVMLETLLTATHVVDHPPTGTLQSPQTLGEAPSLPWVGAQGWISAILRLVVVGFDLPTLQACMKESWVQALLFTGCCFTPGSW